MRDNVVVDKGTSRWLAVGLGVLAVAAIVVGGVFSTLGEPAALVAILAVTAALMIAAGRG